MPRPKRNRKISNIPIMIGFKPFGIQVDSLEKVILHFDEYESFIYCDYDGLNHDEAAVKMNISRPTLTRIYESARKKIAKAFKEGFAIVIEGGEIEFDCEWYRCKKCFKLINGIENHKPCLHCDNYCNEELEKLNKN